LEQPQKDSSKEQNISYSENFDEILKVIPTPIKYNGRGDDVIEIEKPDEGRCVFYIKGNEEGGYFSVKGYDNRNNYTSLFVNTTDEYEGITLDKNNTMSLAIKSKGPWLIETRSLKSLRKINTAIHFTGTGDEVLLVDGKPKIATITSYSNINNYSDHYLFAIKAYNSKSNSLVYTNEIYDGKVRVPSDTKLIEIIADSKWDILLN
jgi:hypothetical protein